MLLSACAWLAPRQLPELPLLPPADFVNAQENYTGAPLQFSEEVRIRHQGEEQVMLAAWVVSAKTIDLVGLTPTGQRLMTLRYDGKTFSEDYSALVTEPIPGRQVLSHMQMARWPQASVERALKSTPWRVEFQQQQRQLFLGTTLVMRIDKTDEKRIRISSPVMDYELEVRAL